MNAGVDWIVRLPHAKNPAAFDGVQIAGERNAGAEDETISAGFGISIVRIVHALLFQGGDSDEGKRRESDQADAENAACGMARCVAETEPHDGGGADK